MGLLVTKLQRAPISFYHNARQEYDRSIIPYFLCGMTAMVTVKHQRLCRILWSQLAHPFCTSSQFKYIYALQFLIYLFV